MRKKGIYEISNDRMSISFINGLPDIEVASPILRVIVIDELEILVECGSFVSKESYNSYNSYRKALEEERRMTFIYR